MARGTVGVFSLGGVGLFATRFTVSMGFRVIGFDISPAARAQAEKAGAFKTFNSSDIAALTGEVLKVTNGRDLDGAIVAAGVIPVYEAAVKLTRVFGTVAVPRDAIQVDFLCLIRKGHTIKGTLTGSASDLAGMMRIVQEHQIIPNVQPGSSQDLPDLFAQCAAGKELGKLGAVIS